MTQPPNHQPPQGGFGAPQDPPPPQQPPQQQPPQQQPSPQQPPQGGFGDAPQAPQTPPPPAQSPQAPPPTPPQPQPGYGYPQQPGSGPYAQPPGPYNQPGPYGYPQQPGPYAQPQPPGYGYPQPQYPGAPGTPPGGGSGGGKSPFKGKPAMIIGAAVAVLLVIGGTVFAVTRGGDDGDQKKPVAKESKGSQESQDSKPSGDASAPIDQGDGSGDGDSAPEDLNEGRRPGEAKVLWYKEGPDAPGSGAEALGLWITDKAAVKAAYKQLFAYNVDDGKPTWDAITFPEEICAVTEQPTAAEKIIVAYKSGSSDRAKCNQLQEVDLNTGEKGWTAEVEEGGLFDSALQIELNVMGNTLMVGRDLSGTAYDVTTGKKKWDKEKYGASCFPSAFTGGAKLISVSSCGAGTDTAHDEVQELNPANGKAKWTQKIPKGWEVQRAYSVDPVVLYLTNEEKDQWNVSVLKDADGTFRSELQVDESFAPDCGFTALSRDLQGCTGVAVGADTLYLPTEATGGANEIVAISLADGKEKWRVKSPAGESMKPMKLDGANLLAYVEPSYDAGGQVVSIPTGGKSHKPVKLLQNPQGTADIENSFYSKAIDYVDGRFYISTTRLTGNDEAQEKLMLAYGE
ncbi:outer membrane protein assembly factor BamB family protein [Streptomyces sp. NPDC002845]